MYWVSTILLHGAYGTWDEILGIVLAILVTAALIIVWRISRKFEPELEADESETGKRKIR